MFFLAPTHCVGAEYSMHQHYECKEIRNAGALLTAFPRWCDGNEITVTEKLT